MSNIRKSVFLNTHLLFHNNTGPELQTMSLFLFCTQKMAPSVALYLRKQESKKYIAQLLMRIFLPSFFSMFALIYFLKNTTSSFVYHHFIFLTSTKYFDSHSKFLLCFPKQNSGWVRNLCYRKL